MIEPENIFYIIIGKDPTQLDEFLEKYEVSPITPFINGNKKDIAYVKTAISFSVSSGFAEGGTLSNASSFKHFDRDELRKSR